MTKSQQMKMNRTMEDNDKILASELVVVVIDGRFEIVKSKYGQRGEVTLSELQRLLAGATKN